jgi:hypothetical protein
MRRSTIYTLAQKQKRMRGFGYAAALVLALVASPVSAETCCQDGALPPLPTVPSIDPSAPDPTTVEELEGLLSRLVAADASERDEAARQILEISPRSVPAIDRKLAEIAEMSDLNELKRALLAVRDKAREAERQRMRAAGETGEVKTPDYLIMLVTHARPDSEAWQRVTAVVAMSRILTQIGSVESARALIGLYARFGEFLRVDTQLQLAKIGDPAVAALVEAQRHKAQRVGSWASRQLDSLGKAIASEAVQTEDHAALADILRAYGRIRDPDAARIVISFANSERLQVRLAARQAVAMMGEVALWQLRDTYENTVGKRPPRDWSWERTARELFNEFDRLRLSRSREQFEQGLAAQEQGNLERMREAFDDVLAHSPLFDQRERMTEGYLAYAAKHAESEPSKAVSALRRAARLDMDPARKQRTQSLLLTLEAQRLAEAGVVDLTLLRRAIELDEGNDRAQAALRGAEHGEIIRRSEFGRYAAALAITSLALLGVTFILLWPRLLKRYRKGSATAKAPTADAAETTEDPRL